MSQLIFTKDFRQQVRGKLKAGSKCIISYDPLRLIPLTKDYLHGDPNNPITVHIKFSASEVQLDLLLYSKIGVTNAPVIRNDGLGLYIMEMLTTLFRAKLTTELADFWVAANAIKACTKIVI